MKFLQVLFITLASIGMFSSSPQQSKASSEVRFLEQGWPKEIQEKFYFTEQGSRMIPLKWFMAIETVDGIGMLADTANLERYGFLASYDAPRSSPEGLPIGFAVDPVSDPDRGKYLGLTCAACHTANITVKGKLLRIDGAPAHLDFDSFYADLAEAVKATLFEKKSFGRFAERVLESPTSENKRQLRRQFARFQTMIAADAAIRNSGLLSGPGRLDALTQIVNSLAVVGQGDYRNLRAANAPTSFPYLWLTPQLENVQWNPIASSPIGRNGGEVLGVFGEIQLTGDPGNWFKSSMLLRNLHELESWIADLEPPRWDEKIFGPINGKLASKGEKLFDDHCRSCHNKRPYDRTPVNEFGKSFIKIGRVDYQEIGTDPVYVESLLQRLVYTNDATMQLCEGKPMVPGVVFFGRTVGAASLRAKRDQGIGEAEWLAMNGFRKPVANCDSSPPRDLKASPLPGIWATGPFLHNGSVPTIEELLSPENERRKVFWTGGREIDLKRLGFVSDEAPGLFRFDTRLPGNGNKGHVYPKERELSEGQRKAVIEYLKQLGE